MLKKAVQRLLRFLLHGQPASIQNILTVRFTVMCIIINSCRFDGVFKHVRPGFFQRLGKLKIIPAETAFIPATNRSALETPNRGIKIIDGMKAPKNEPMRSNP